MKPRRPRRVRILQEFTAVPSTSSALAGAVSATILTLSALAATPALAADPGLYVRADLGLSFVDGVDDGNWLDPDSRGLGGALEDSTLFGGGIGYRFTGSLRADVTLLYRGELDYSSKAEDEFGNTGTAAAAAASLTGLVNVYYDVPVDFALRPFIGAGAGFARNRLGAVDYTLNGADLDREEGETTTRFAWAAMAGLSLDVSPALTVELAYRYLDAGEIATSGDFASGGTLPALSSDLVTHEATVGFRYRF